MKRRQFLRALGGTSAAVAGFSLDSSLKFGFHTAQAAHTSTFGKTVVVVYLRGGNDGINTVIPYGTDVDSQSSYYRLGFRDTIQIAPPNLADPTAALDLNIAIPGNQPQSFAEGMGFHPAFAGGLYDLYKDGNLAIMPATHYSGASRSHFSGQQFTESAKADLLTDGVFNRYLVDSGVSTQGIIRGVGLSSNLPHMLRGSQLVSAFSDLRGFELGISNQNIEAEVLARLIDVYNQSPDANRSYSTLLHDFGSVTLKDLDIVAELNDGSQPELDPDGYEVANGYGTSTFARQIAQTALLIKAGRGLEVASLSRGGFDWHSNQGGGEATGNHYKSLKDVSDGIKSFFDDLSTVNPATGSAYMDNVLVMICSEFGRTSYENGSFGVDHAHATPWMVLGSTDNVNGGVYLGHENTLNGNPGTTPITNWANYQPLADANMINGRYLNHTIDYRNLYGEIFANFLIANYGVGSPDMGTLLPDFTYSDATKIGFLI